DPYPVPEPRREPTPPPKDTVKEPEVKPPPKAPVREPDPKPDPEPEKPKWTPSKDIKVNLNKTTKTPTAAQQAAEKAREQRERETREALNNSINRLQSQFQTQISFSIPGSGGASYANYGAYVRTIYDRNWREPAGSVEGNPTVKARIVIARDGKVVSSEIVDRSGQPAMDRSIQELLGRIQNIGRSFPDGAKDDQRSFILTFNLKSKLGLG
ncbi:MAG: TonB C-terminal domain-containing protein, partial [Verrucomicrobiae bacterium]|nr:TonB C-terminal domain-containing protein [Verrucomicrobiae bacterium]